MGATVGTEQLNAGFVDSAPWTERHPWLLWTALAVAVLVLGGLADPHHASSAEPSSEATCSD